MSNIAAVPSVSGTYAIEFRAERSILRRFCYVVVDHRNRFESFVAVLDGPTHILWSQLDVIKYVKVDAATILEESP